MKKKVRKLIESYVSDLPPIVEERKVGVTGAAIIEHEGKNFKDRNGKKVKENLMYQTKIEESISHFNRAKVVYFNAPKGKEEAALQQYRENVLELAERQQKKFVPPVIKSV